MKRNMEHLKKVKKADSSTRKKMLKKTDLLQCICECALNILKDNVPLKQTQFKKLRRHRHEIKKLASKLVQQKDNQKIVQNGGGLLSDIITPTLDFFARNNNDGDETDKDTDISDCSDVDEYDADMSEDSDEEDTGSDGENTDTDDEESDDTGEEGEDEEEEDGEETETGGGDTDDDDEETVADSGEETETIYLYKPVFNVVTDEKTL
jgi:hypothetical protein